MLAKSSSSKVGVSDDGLFSSWFPLSRFASWGHGAEKWGPCSSRSLQESKLYPEGGEDEVTKLDGS